VHGVKLDGFSQKNEEVCCQWHPHSYENQLKWCEVRRVDDHYVNDDAQIMLKFERSHPVIYHQICVILVPSIHNTCKDQMFYYNWVTLGEMFRQLNGHFQANLE